MAESKRPFKILSDRGFRNLMKTGWPEYHLPSLETASHDTCKGNWKLDFVTFHITDPTPSPSPPKTFRRRIVDHQYYQLYAPYFRPDNSRLGPNPPAPYHMQNHSYPILGTSLVNGLRPTHASLFGISDYGYAQSRYHMIQFTSPHVYSFHHMLVSYYHVVLCI